MLPCLGNSLPSPPAWKSLPSPLSIKIPMLLPYKNHCPLFHYQYPFDSKGLYTNHFSLTRMASTVNAASPIHKFSAMPNKSRKKARRDFPEELLRHKLDMCSKHGNLVEAVHLYSEAIKNGVPLSLHHYNSLLYLCSSFGSSSTDHLGLEAGFEIFRQMGIDRVSPNEATFTSMARLAAGKEDPVTAFDLVKQMKIHGVPPKLRSYEPALHGFCKKGDVDMAYEVDDHMIESGVLIDESGLRALLKLSSDVNKYDKVYEMLHRLRVTGRQLDESTIRVIEDWFNSEAAVDAGQEEWDVEKVREGAKKGGGGWHGQGWLGSGKWNVVRTKIDDEGLCCSCSERLLCIDIDLMETGNLASSLTSLVCQREAKADFKEFQEWLQQHGPFEAIVDGANVGVFSQRGFRFSQLSTVVNKLQQTSSTKRLPLIILHQSRVHGGPARNLNNKKLLENWTKSGALYATPSGSNDDWYWLYAAVSCGCLLVTNDEMRDHLFQLLGAAVFPRWKEKHQVRLSFSMGGELTLHMPPPYSTVIQESETGSWHVPTVTGDDIETPRQWLCITRPNQP